jgi:hypothetical protein
VHRRHSRAADAQISGSRVLSRTQGGAGNRVAGTVHACHAGIGQMRECASAVLGACRPLPDLT